MYVPLREKQLKKKKKTKSCSYLFSSQSTLAEQNHMAATASACRLSPAGSSFPSTTHGRRPIPFNTSKFFPASKTSPTTSLTWLRLPTTETISVGFLSFFSFWPLLSLGSFLFLQSFFLFFYFFIFWGDLLLIFTLQVQSSAYRIHSITAALQNTDGFWVGKRGF